MNLTIDVSTLRVKDMKALERLRTYTGITAWFIEHAGANGTELDELTLPELQALAADTMRQINEGLKLPKANGSNS